MVHVLETISCPHNSPYSSIPVKMLNFFNCIHTHEGDKRGSVLNLFISEESQDNTQKLHIGYSYHGDAQKGYHLGHIQAPSFE